MINFAFVFSFFFRSFLVLEKHFFREMLWSRNINEKGDFYFRAAQSEIFPINAMPMRLRHFNCTFLYTQITWKQEKKNTKQIARKSHHPELIENTCFPAKQNAKWICLANGIGQYLFFSTISRDAFIFQSPQKLMRREKNMQECR